MQNLIEFLAKYNHWIVFVLLEVISFVLILSYNSYQSSVWFSSANTVAGKIYEISAEVESFLSLTTVNRELTQRNVYLEHELHRMESRLRQQGDTSALRSETMRTLAEYKLIPAKVVSNEVAKRDNLITIDKGSLDGVREDMGVVCGNGVVGIVYLVSPHYSVVIPVLNSNSNISCVIQGRDYFGYLHWTGGNSRKAFIDDVPRHAHFRLGDKVVTSGYSSVFPPGVMVGKILHVFNSPDGQAYRLQVELSTDFGRLRDVCVVNDTLMNERLQVIRAAQDSMRVK